MDQPPGPVEQQLGQGQDSCSSHQQCELVETAGDAHQISLQKEACPEPQPEPQPEPTLDANDQSRKPDLVVEYDDGLQNEGGNAPVQLQQNIDFVTLGMFIIGKSAHGAPTWASRSNSPTAFPFTLHEPVSLTRRACYLHPGRR